MEFWSILKILPRNALDIDSQELLEKRTRFWEAILIDVSLVRDRFGTYTIMIIKVNMNFKTLMEFDFKKLEAETNQFLFQLPAPYLLSFPLLHNFAWKISAAASLF